MELGRSQNKGAQGAMIRVLPGPLTHGKGSEPTGHRAPSVPSRPLPPIPVMPVGVRVAGWGMVKGANEGGERVARRLPGIRPTQAVPRPSAQPSAAGGTRPAPGRFTTLSQCPAAGQKPAQRAPIKATMPSDEFAAGIKRKMVIVVRPPPKGAKGGRARKTRRLQTVRVEEERRSEVVLPPLEASTGDRREQYDQRTRAALEAAVRERRDWKPPPCPKVGFRGAGAAKRREEAHKGLRADALIPLLPPRVALSLAGWGVRQVSATDRSLLVRDAILEKGGPHGDILVQICKMIVFIKAFARAMDIDPWPMEPALAALLISAEHSRATSEAKGSRGGETVGAGFRTTLIAMAENFTFEIEYDAPCILISPNSATFALSLLSCDKN